MSRSSTRRCAYARARVTPVNGAANNAQMYAPDKTKLGRRPDDEILRKARQVHTVHAGVGQELEHKVAIAGGVN